jgi:hypothetical protein
VQDRRNDPFYAAYAEGQDWAVENDTITVGWADEPFGNKVLRAVMLNICNFDVYTAASLRNLEPAVVQTYDQLSCAT